MADPTTEKVRFKGGESADLSGVLHEPGAAVTRAAVLLTHCFTCSKDYKLVVQVARSLADRGFPVLRFDFAGSGESEGEFAETTLATNVGDLVAAAEWLQRRGLRAGALVGHSLGATAAILAAHLIPEVAGVCAIASSSTSTHLLELIPSLATDEFSARGELSAKIGGRTVTIRKEFVEELRRHSLKESLGRLGRPFLVVHGTGDRTVPIEEGEKLFLAARQPKSFFAVAGADHLFSLTEHSRAASEAIGAWLSTCELEGEAT